MQKERGSTALLGIGLGVLGLFLISREAEASPGFPSFTSTNDIMAYCRGPGNPANSIKDFITPSTVGFLYGQYDAPALDETILNLWEYVAVAIAYVEDIGEYWRFPIETVNERVGDCEDTSFLLASLLLNRLSETYVAAGYFVYGGNLYGHAWVVARTLDGDFVLESTLDSLPSDRWLTTEEGSSVYRPFIYWNNYTVLIRPGWQIFVNEVRQVLGRKKDDIEDFWRTRGLSKKKGTENIRLNVHSLDRSRFPGIRNRRAT